MGSIHIHRTDTTYCLSITQRKPAMDKTTFIPKIRHGLAAAALTAVAMLQGGCESMVYDGTDCTASYNIIRLKYDRNMKFADAFDAEVESVSLLAFRADDGTLVKRIDMEADALSPDNEVVLEVDPGEYDILVWAGRYEESFDIAKGVTGESVLSDFYCRMHRSTSDDGSMEVTDDLARLYHGLVHVNCPYASEAHPNRMEIPLTKDTNSVRVLLQQVSGEPLDCRDFRFEITDANGWLNADNSLRNDGMLTYSPWYLYSGSVDINTNPSDAPNNRSTCDIPAGRASMGAALAEFTVGRLMWGAEPRLRITHAESGQEVLDININDYAMLVRGYYNRQMDEQEYLDRQDEYNMTFFLDNNMKWISTVIIINDWRIVRHEGPIE